MQRMARVLCLAVAGCCFVGQLGPRLPARVARAATEDGEDAATSGILKCAKDRAGKKLSRTETYNRE